MPKVLTQEQIDSYRTDGYLAPMDGIDPADAAAMLEDLDAFEAANGISAGQLQMKGHLCFRRSYNFTLNPRRLTINKIAVAVGCRRSNYLSFLEIP